MNCKKKTLLPVFYKFANKLLEINNLPLISGKTIME